MKKQVQLSEYKSVRIDSKTIILVKRDIPDDVARKRYLDNIGRSFALTQRCGIMPPRQNNNEEELPDIEKETEDGEEEEERD